MLQVCYFCGEKIYGWPVALVRRTPASLRLQKRKENAVVALMAKENVLLYIIKGDKPFWYAQISIMDYLLKL